MKYFIHVIIILLCLSKVTFGQFTVPDSVLAEIELKETVFQDKIYKYKIKYPSNFDSTLQYPVLLGLGGGNQNQKIIDYCYYTLFKSDYLRKHIIIMPVSDEGLGFSMFDSIATVNLLSALRSNENTKDSDWTIAGTSFGGIIGFNFASYQPELFNGIIVFPGAPLSTFPKGPPINVIPNAPTVEVVPDEWKKYQIILAVGENDDKIWQNATNAALKMLLPKVKNTRKYVMKGQGHAVSPSFNIDLIYKQYFK